MGDVRNCIKKYIELTNNEIFILHGKRLAEKLLKGISNGYTNKFREDNIVKIIEDIINSVGQFDTKNNTFNISTASVFIHGNKSQVTFEYYGKVTQRELGDIIFILSIVCNGKKYFEKMTINQIKKSKNISWNFNNDSAKEQLYLLSRFPTFKGVNGSLIPVKEYNLLNDSGCLGTHGLLYKPGDFALISSKQLDIIISRKKTLKLENLALLNTDTYFPHCCFLDKLDIVKCLLFYYELIAIGSRYFRCLPFRCNLPIMGNNCLAYNAYDFSNKYLSGLIGELIYAKGVRYNLQVLSFLMDLLDSVEARGGKYRYFVQDFRQFKYNPIGDWKDNNDKNKEYYKFYKDGGGLGIIYTIIDLGEEKDAKDLI